MAANGAGFLRVDTDNSGVSLQIIESALISSVITGSIVDFKLPFSWLSTSLANVVFSVPRYGYSAEGPPTHELSHISITYYKADSPSVPRYQSYFVSSDPPELILIGTTYHVSVTKFLSSDPLLYNLILIRGYNGPSGFGSSSLAPGCNWYLKVNLAAIEIPSNNNNSKLVL